jgi:DNA-directed RNA polymerase specialized sigma24 family protein
MVTETQMIAANTKQSLDQLASAAAAGDQVSESLFFSYLNVRFSQIAKRRVRNDDAEDVVQDALRIVAERYGNRAEQVRTLAFSLTVLRNVIGNYYQKRERTDRGQPFDEGLHGYYTDSPDMVREQVKKALVILAEEAPRCGLIFEALLESLDLGGGSREVSGRLFEKLQSRLEGITRNAFHVALHRCRDRLRTILEELDHRGVRVTRGL